MKELATPDLDVNYIRGLGAHVPRKASLVRIQPSPPNLYGQVALWNADVKRPAGSMVRLLPYPPQLTLEN